MLGFQPGESDDSDSDKENNPQSSPSASPWAKRQKVSPVIDLSSVKRKLASSNVTLTSSGTTPNHPLRSQFSSSTSMLSLGESQDNKHTNLVKSISNQLMKYRPDRALRTMKLLPNFDKHFQNFVREECRLEADNILKNKDPPIREFNLQSLRNFQYSSELSKLELSSPTLMASIAGSISASQDSIANLTRKGFGGARRSEDISLVPSMVQTASCILRNRHPNSISTVQCVNSLNNWVLHIPHQYFFLNNSLGQSFSKKTTVNLVDQINEDHDRSIVKMKKEIEEMHKKEKTNRGLRARASAGGSGFALFGDNVGKVINPRFNTGLKNKGSYLQMAITIGVINRIPSAHLSDVPLISPKEVSFFPSEVDLDRIRRWMKFKMGQVISEHHPAFSKCGKYIKPPEVSYPASKRSKSDMSILSLSIEDPSSHDGMIRVSEKLIPYIPCLPSGINQKTVLFGDQLYIERGHSASWGRCGEKDPISKLEGLVFIPQEWHKKQEDLLIFNQRFNLSHQVASPGTLQNIKNSFGHNKAAKDVGNFYACWDLAEVKTTINLVALVCDETGLGLNSQDAGYSRASYGELIDMVLDRIDLLSKWSPDDKIAEDDQTEGDANHTGLIVLEEQEDQMPDSMLNFHQDLTFYGVLMLAQKSASQFGDGEGALAMWKNSITDYNDELKPKYRICAHRKIAACAGVFGAKIQTDTLHNCYVNDQGREDTNVEGDLKVEHVNCQFKASLMHLCGNYTEDSLQRVAKSLDITRCLQEKLLPNYVDSEESMTKLRMGHRTGDWSDQVCTGVKELCDVEVFKYHSGREMPGAEGYSRKDKVDFKGLRRHIKRYNKELSYYIKDTF